VNDKSSELLDICQELAQQEPTPVAVRRMHELLVLCCSEAGRQQGGTFGNLFSQVDWLCEKLGIGMRDKIAIQTARRHSNGHDTLTHEEWLTDLRAVEGLILEERGERREVRGERREVRGARNFETSKPRNPGILKSRNNDAPPRIPYIRCIVRRFDLETIWADTEDGPVIVDYGNTERGRDFRYLQKILREGMQLILIDNEQFIDERTINSGAQECSMFNVQCSIKLRPALIVVEPDYLIDVSSLAGCFTSYGHHPLLYTLAKLKPRANTQAILLGNFAGTALDEAIREGASNFAGIYQRALRRSFSEQALRFCACEDFDAEQFKLAAADQVKNICEVVKVLKSDSESSMSNGHCSMLNAPCSMLLEPSFVCERLGLQGRVDLMTADMSLLVEQKSGKNMKIEYQSHDSHGMQREDHYVQLLLYYGILRYNFGVSEQQVDTRLLYSRYPAEQGLLRVNYYRTLFREAIKLRNQIVATDFLIAREGFGRILPLLNADTIYKGIARDGFFHHYVEPDLNHLASIFSQLTPTERAYFTRMMTFVYREQLCQKLGVEEGIGGSTADLWQMPLAEKRETGNIFTNLTITHRERTIADGGFDLITLNVPVQGDDFLPNFRRGDMVYLYRYDEMPDVRHSILYKGTLQEIKPDELLIALNDGQQQEDVFKISDKEHWAVEHGSSDITSTNQVKGLFQLMTTRKDRRDLLLGQRDPQADTTLILSKAYHPNYDDILLRAKQACDYFLLVGPPGTGKTSMALRFLVTEELTMVRSSSARLIPKGSKNGQCLLTAYTNRAVDEICEMLCDAGFDFLRIGNEASCDPRYRDHLLEASLEATTSLDDIRRRIDDTSIIVGTTSMLQSRTEIFHLKHFSLAIVDEASQILEPGIIGLLASEQIDRFILIGDYKQLPAVVQQHEQQTAVEEAELKNIGVTDCRQSLFERLIRWEQQCGRTQFIGTLQKQGRMHPDVASFPSRLFYQQEHLDVVPLQHQRAAALDYSCTSEDELDEQLKHHRMLFIPVRPQTTGGSDKANEAEAAVVADLLRRIYRFYGEQFDSQKTVGVIVPYRNQIAMIRRVIQELDMPELMEVSIDTVERYQGSQRDVIIYSFTVSRRYQLDFLTSNTFEEDHQSIDRKLNVALTRARKQMLMTGNPEVLSVNPLFRELINNYNIEGF